jgi:acetylornithine deacetylase/succinyl-diaminopimelate desuccinylase-like protein
MQVDRSDLIRTLSDLVRINSINPVLVPGAPGEGEIARYVAAWLGDAGLEILMVEPEAGRPSVAARLPGTGGGRSLMLNAHMDTVGVEGMADAWSGAVREGKLYGRGAYDMKGSLAACMVAAKVLAGEPRLRGDLVVAAVADEEYGSIGTAGLLERVRTDAAIVTEPTSLRICRAHKGYLWIEVEVEGRAAHGSRFDLGIDANLRMGRFLVALEALERELRARPPHPLVGPPSLHAALLEGGTGLSTYAASSRVRIERRTVPGETEAGAVGEIDALLDRLRQADPSLRISRSTFFSRDSFEICPDAGIVRALDAAARRVLPEPPPHVGDTPWMDSALTAAAGIETVVFGPHGTGAHAAEEWVDVESVVTTASVLVETARDWCR